MRAAGREPVREDVTEQDECEQQQDEDRACAEAGIGAKALPHRGLRGGWQEGDREVVRGRGGGGGDDYRWEGGFLGYHRELFDGEIWKGLG